MLQPLGHGRENSRFCNFSGLTSLYLSLNDSLSLSLSLARASCTLVGSVATHASVASWQTSCSHQMGSHSALQAFVGPRVLLTAASGLMSYGPDLAHALGSAIAPHVEAIVQQRTSAAMALFVNTIHPDTISQVYGEQGNRRRAQEFMCQHADGLLQQHMQGASAAQQPKPGVLQKEDEQPEQVASENAKTKHASRGGAKRIGKYRVETGVLEIFARFTPDLPGTTAPLHAQLMRASSPRVTVPSQIRRPRNLHRLHHHLWIHLLSCLEEDSRRTSRTICNRLLHRKDNSMR